MHSVLSVVLLTVHMMLALALIGVVLLQRSEGGMGGLGGGGMSGFMTTRGSANLLTRTTRWLAGIFMATSLVLAWIAAHDHAATPIIAPGVPPVEAPAPDQAGGAAGSSAPANDTSGTGSTTGSTTGTPTTTETAPATGAAPSAPAVPTNQ
jgi:preprotein translocase subunit SecG